ncbi:MAG: peptide chain release factor N(5)-glutamine methyltransferase [Candidatus Sulfobium sp.]
MLDIMRSATHYLDKAGVSDAGADAELLVLHFTGIDRMTAYRDNPEVDDAVQTEITGLLGRRAAGEPVQYILGSVDFLGLRIEVGKGVLIPRPETELVAQEGIRLLRNFSGSPSGPGRRAALRILDLCSGSGCISLALGREFPDAAVFGTDISEAAIRYAVRNAEINGIANATFMKGSLYEPAEGMQLFDLIISNPPYIVTSDLNGLQREIREWEPVAALDGGPDGLDFYRKIFSRARGHLKKSGAVVLELGFGQAGEVAEMAEKAGFGKIDIREDMAGIKRVLTAETASGPQSSHLQG